MKRKRKRYNKIGQSTQKLAVKNSKNSKHPCGASKNQNLGENPNSRRLDLGDIVSIARLVLVLKDLLGLSLGSLPEAFFEALKKYLAGLAEM